MAGRRLRTRSPDPDLSAVRAVRVPDRGAGIAGDGEATLVDGGVVALADQGAVLAGRLAAPGPVVDMVEVAPGRGGRATREHAVPVALLGRPADTGGRRALLLPDVQRQAVRAG